LISSCHFCNGSVANRIVLENGSGYACLTNIPIVPGHLLVCPRRHVGDVNSLTEEELKDLFDLVVRIKPALSRSLDATGFNFAWNEGIEAGQSVAHFHMHVVPRKAGDAGITEYEPRKFLYRPGSRAVSPDEELFQVCRLIKESL
jgi:diadenosine tetraphosphate (Ap4A) HIT family hydrolase